MGDINSIRVALRIRPLVKSERDRGCQQAVERTAAAQQVTVNGSEAFTFNYVFGVDDTQETVYNESVTELLDKLFGGFNATILAYGQTGSGKTHTMGTAFSGDLDEDTGVIPRAMHDIFRRIEKLAGEYEFTVTCSFMELYQEQLYDLLSTSTREQSVVEMREDRNGIKMTGLTEHSVRSARETTDCLLRGSSGRAVASTAMNQASSRSHAIFTVTILATKLDAIKTVTTSKFHLVDLAGSERSKKTQATGDRFKEGVKINQGLLALGNVISALGSGQGSGFVQYRESKLTRLLQDSLGGNSITLMIACVSPADYNVPETMSTLRYADRARKIKNKPIVNQDPHAAEINQLKGIIQKLRMELLAAGGGMSNSLTGALQSVVSTAASSGDTVSEVHLKAHQQLQEKYRNLQQHLQMTLHDVAENEMRAHIAEAAHDKLKVKTNEMRSIVCDLARDFKADASPETLSQHIENVQQICKLVEGLDEELERTQTEISDHRRRYSIGSSVNGGACAGDEDDGDGSSSETTPEVRAQMQEEADAFTNKQMDFKEQLRRINRELNLKEELHQRVAGNFTKFCTLDDNIDEKFKECETKIQELEAEKSDLLDKLRHVKSNASAKLAEERRKRLQTLEQEINDMKRKNTQQSKLLKVREKETQKIKNLNTEIQAMKESKVKLIRSMRQESEQFRQWKLTREKELMQLKNKDRKMQNEMARKEALHTKQRNVLKRKCEEALAINKRLKDALERQKVAQSQRQKLQSVKDSSAANTKIEQAISWVERQLEVIISLIDAEHTLEQLMEDRGIITSRIAELQSKSHSSAAQELANLEEELEMRNAQIADLQQKVCAADLDTRMHTLFDSIQTLAEARGVLKHLLKAIAEMRREHANRSQEQKTSLEEQRALCDSAEERCSAAAKRMRLMEIEHEEAIAERENTYEEKIAVLLRELHNAPQLADGTALTPEQEERQKIQEEQLNKMDTLREELDYYKQLVTDLQQAVEARQQRKAPKRVAQVEKNEEDMDDTIDLSSGEENEQNDSDPDWIKTPRFARRKRSNHSRRTTASNNSDQSISTNMDETYATAASGPGVAAAAPSSGELKRKSKGCSCRGNCGNKRCGCHSNAEKCTVACRCSEACSNGKFGAQQQGEAGGDAKVPEEEEESQNTTPTNVTYGSLAEDHNKDDDATFAKPDVTFQTPKIARLSTISFDTASAKKKFFN